MSGWVARGEAEVESLLAAIPERLRHSRAVAHRAGELADLVEVDDRDLLIAAAWVHDIGYAPALRESGFHPLDGARYLERCGWPARICALVAHHSGARFVAAVRGLADELSRFPFEDSTVMDALTFADQTIGPNGIAMSPQQRVHDMLARHGPDSSNARAHPDRSPYLRAVAARMRDRSRIPSR